MAKGVKWKWWRWWPHRCPADTVYEPPHRLLYRNQSSNDLFPSLFFSLSWYPSQNDTMRVIYMYHEKEPHGAFYTPGSLPDPAEAFKQARSLFLTQRINQTPLKPDPRLKTLELLNQDVNLPQGDGTLHWCKMFKLNDINRKHHLIRVSSWWRPVPIADNRIWSNRRAHRVGLMSAPATKPRTQGAFRCPTSRDCKFALSRCWLFIFPLCCVARIARGAMGLGNFQPRIALFWPGFPNSPGHRRK